MTLAATSTKKDLDRGTTISTLWLVVMFSMVFADILSFMVPGTLAGLSTGKAEDLVITQGLLLAFAILLEIPIAMILLSRILAPRVNRWANIGAGVVSIIFVIGGGSASLHYYFFAAVEVICMLWIIRLSWTWKSE